MDKARPTMVLDMKNQYPVDDQQIFSPPTPYESNRLRVLPGWIDGNGHMNVAYYLLAFDQAFDEVYEALDISFGALAGTGISTMAAENHLTYQGEVFEGNPLRITSQLLAFDAKRFQWFQCMYHAEKGYLAATCEWMVLCVDLTARRVAEFPADLQARLGKVLAAHASLPLPPEAGRAVSLKSRRRPIA